MWVCCVHLDLVVLVWHCCYFSMPFYHLLVSLLGVKMTSVGGGKPRRQSWSPFHVNLGENKHANSHTIPDTFFHHEDWAVSLKHVMCIIVFARDMNAPVSLSISSLSPKPMMEEIKQWAQSFDKLMKTQRGETSSVSSYGRSTARRTCFWLACEDLKNEINKSVIEEKTRLIYEDYVSSSPPKRYTHKHTT